VHPGLQPGDVERIASSLLMAVADAAPVITRQR
jgi:hypothetical protein